MISWLPKQLSLSSKAIDTILPVHKAQLLTYMRLGGWPVGLLINFNVTQLIKGVTRFINGKLEQ